MDNKASTLIIPVENQVRELDAKLLLACIAAERGYPVILGSRAYCHFKAASIPRGVYLAKSMRRLSNAMFKILRMSGHEIVFWEEEALVHPPPEVYFTLRLSPATIKLVSHVFAWSRENADLLKQYPHLPEKLPIHITGNPRGDMLRPEMRSYFAEDVSRIRKTYGDFILINTNFSDVNPFIPGVGTLLPPNKFRRKPRLGQAGKGMNLEFAQGLHDHRQRILADFIDLVPRLEQAFPDLTIIIRPHPSEKHDIYNKLSGQCSRVQVENDGSVIPWLLAAEAMIHNGCTTALEACQLKVPTVSYEATVNEYYDTGIHAMPASLSYQCGSFAELKVTLRQILDGKLGVAGGRKRQEVVDYHLAAQEGALACERIMDVLDAAGYGKRQPPATSAGLFIQGWLFANIKAALTKLNMRRFGPNRLGYHDHRFPELSVADIERRVARFGSILNRFDNITIRPHSRHLLDINSEPSV